MSLWQTALVSALSGMIVGWVSSYREQKKARQLERESLSNKELLDTFGQSSRFPPGTTATENGYEPHRRTFRQ